MFTLFRGQKYASQTTVNPSEEHLCNILSGRSPILPFFFIFYQDIVLKMFPSTTLDHTYQTTKINEWFIDRMDDYSTPAQMTKVRQRAKKGKKLYDDCHPLPTAS